MHSVRRRASAMRRVAAFRNGHATQTPRSHFNFAEVVMLCLHSIRTTDGQSRDAGGAALCAATSAIVCEGCDVPSDSACLMAISTFGQLCSSESAPCSTLAATVPQPILAPAKDRIRPRTKQSHREAENRVGIHCVIRNLKVSSSSLTIMGRVTWALRGAC